jgi:hypothetical protein
MEIYRYIEEHPLLEALGLKIGCEIALVSKGKATIISYSGRKFWVYDFMLDLNFRKI